jgi:hypothetical protein
MGRSSLIVRNPGGLLSVSDEGRSWLQNRDTSFLMAILHRNVRFFGEILSAVKNGITTHEELRRHAVSDYSLPWDTLAQVRRRTSWLRSADFLELWPNNELVLTSVGEDFLNKIELASPEDVLPAQADSELSAQSFNLREGTRIAADIEALDQRNLHDRKRAISYIPGGDPVDVILQLVSLAEAPISRDKFEELCAQEFDIAASSARSALAALRSSNLLEQTGPTTFTISQQAREWMESDDPLDLVRIFHCNFLGFLELLPLMQDPLPAGELARRLEGEYGISRLSADEVARRLRILESAGLVQRVTQMTCKRTALGEAFAQSVPLLDRISDKGTSAMGQGDLGDDSGASTISTIDSVRQRIDALTSELVASSTDVTNTTRFEKAIAAALDALGFSARHIGGPGKTDVLVTAWLGPGASRTIAVDAKTAASGIKDSIDFNVLGEHRKIHNASSSAVVAPGFDDRTIGWARDHNVALVTARQLASALSLQASYPISLPELAQIFAVDGIEALAERWAAVRRKDDIMAAVVQRLWKSANNTGHVEASGGALSARDLWLMMIDEETAASQDEIEEVLHFLSLSLIGAAERRGDTYVALSPPSLVAERVSAIRAAIKGEARPAVESVTSITGTPDVQPRRADRSPSSPPGIPDPADVRRWAREQGIQVSHRGRLSSHLIDRYRAYHADATGHHATR